MTRRVPGVRSSAVEIDAWDVNCPKHIRSVSKPPMSKQRAQQGVRIRDRENKWHT
ncbi:hypothetical protein C7405_107156 [Paraburkholderia caballeronis]|uniref:hypothetical protein n=1 Tax=Paraburkholderia caballeronis TaxID=416943 RepID=UPI0010EFC23A|nr:hypothetical protein [Paraburkholderia caballeronis]TDV34757.1 hypothetical protein C7405_107156 [Paraburkholderia caballeronis]